MDRHPAPPPNPYPLGPYLRPWQFLQNRTDSCSLQFVESRALLHMPKWKKNDMVGHWYGISDRAICQFANLLHLKQVLWNLYPPATRSSAAYTDLLHLGHLGVSTATKGILDCNSGVVEGVERIIKDPEKTFQAFGWNNSGNERIFVVVLQWVTLAQV